MPRSTWRNDKLDEIAINIAKNTTEANISLLSHMICGNNLQGILRCQFIQFYDIIDEPIIKKDTLNGVMNIISSRLHDMLQGKETNVKECLASLDICDFIFTAKKIPDDFQEKKVQLLVHVFDSQIYSKQCRYLPIDTEQELKREHIVEEWERIPQKAKQIWNKHLENVDDLDSNILRLLRDLSIKSIHRRITESQSNISINR